MRWLVVMFATLWAATGHAAEVVQVGGYDFPPFVDSQGGTHHGLAIDLIDTLNHAQSDFEFRFVPVAARRRYADLQDGRFDVMFFESPDWEWAAKGLPVDFSNVFLKGGEVFIAQALPGRGQEYFADLTGKHLVGILGYHYGLAGFDADPARMTKDFNMKLVSNHRSSIEMVALGRTDVAVVTDAYLWAYLSHNPALKDKILVSDRLDQVYNHRALVRRGGPIGVDKVNALLADLQKSGKLDALWTKAGVVP